MTLVKSDIWAKQTLQSMQDESLMIPVWNHVEKKKVQKTAGERKLTKQHNK